MENEKNEIIFYKKYKLLEFVYAGPKMRTLIM